MSLGKQCRRFEGTTLLQSAAVYHKTWVFTTRWSWWRNSCTTIHLNKCLQPSATSCLLVRPKYFSQYLVLNHPLLSSLSTQNKPLFVGEPVSANPSSFSLSAYAQHDVAPYEKAAADRPFRVFDPSKPSNTVIYCAWHSKLPNPTQRSIRYFNRILPRWLTVKIAVSLNYKGRILSVFSVECDFKFLNFPRNISFPRFPQHTTSFLRTLVTH